VFAWTLRRTNTHAFTLAKAVKKLNKQLGRAVTVREISKNLGWEKSLVYKYLREAVQHKLLKYEPGNRERNEKRVLPACPVTEAFLPSPRLVLKKNPELGKKVKYVDPFTGSWKKVKR
jgi:DNA-directed RNA polymerase specialized sigma subunit